VLKTVLGVSGKGHHHIASKEISFASIAPFLHKEWQQRRPVLAEPWLERLLDFSTQWLISAQGAIECIGTTLCHNDAKGRYLSNEVGEEKALLGTFYPFLEQHKQTVVPLLKKIAEQGYFGHVGVDTFIYLNTENDPTLHPVVEINTRKTMGYVALAFQKRYAPNQQIQLAYTPGEAGLLPSGITLPKGKVIRFKRNLQVLSKSVKPI
jgi:hypothetical protein